MSLPYSSNIPVVPGVLSQQSAVRSFISTIDSGTTFGDYNYWAREGGEASHTSLTVSTIFSEQIYNTNFVSSLTGVFQDVEADSLNVFGAANLEVPVTISNGAADIAVFDATTIDLSGANVVVNTINGSAYPPTSILPQSNVAVNTGFTATPVPPSGNPATSGTPLITITGLTFFQAGEEYLIDIPVSFNATTSVDQPITLGCLIGTGVGSEQVFTTLTLINGGGVSGYQYQADITGVATVGPFNTGVLTLYAYNTDPANTPTLTGVAGSITAFFYKMSP